MPDLFFPQLVSGAIAQYPIRKTRLSRTITNLLPNGDLIVAPDPDGSRVLWQMGYSGISSEEMSALVTHFENCAARFRAFTFLDPTENLLANSADLQGSPWQRANLIQLSGNDIDPFAGASAFSLTNQGQVNAEIFQTLPVPANYQYCFSVYAASAQPTTLEVIRRSTHDQHSMLLDVGSSWSRLVSSGKLSDSDTQFTVVISLQPGQRVFLYGPQLEAQVSCSRYRATFGSAGVYSNAHWAIDELPISMDAPNLFSTVFSIEAAV